jgi:hypothetical protein
VTETGTVNLLSIGGSLTSTGVIKAVNSADPANPTTPTGLLGNINTMTVSGRVAGTVQVSGNLTTLTVGTANTPTTGGVNDVLGQIVVGGQLTTGSISGNVSGLVQEDLTVNNLYVGGTITSTGVIKAVNPADPAMPTTTQGLLANINTMTVGGAVAGLAKVSGNLTTLTVGTANTPTTGGVNDVFGTIIVGGQLTTGSISGNISGLVQEDLTINSLYIGGSLTSTGVIQAVNTTPSLGNINTLTIGQNLAGKVIVSGTINNLAIVNGSMTPTGVIQVANLNTMTIGPARLSVGQDMAGQIIVSGTLGSLRVAGGTPGSITAGHIGTVSVYGGFGPVVLQITENGIQRRVEEATPSNSYPLPNPNIQAATSPYATVGAGGVPSYINIQYVYESGTLANPQWTARISNGVGTAPDQYDLSLVTYNDTAKFNLARLDAVGIAGVRNVAVEGDVLTAVSSQALGFFPGDTNAAGIRLPQDKLAGVGVRDNIHNSSIQAASIQAVAFGSYTNSTTKVTKTGVASLGSDAQALLVSGTAMAYSNDTFRAPFADLSSQQVQMFLVTNPLGGSFDSNGIRLTVQSVTSPNAAGTANIITPSNVARGAATALVTVVATHGTGNTLLNPVVQSIELRGDGGSIQTQQPFSATSSITSTGPLGDLTVLSAQGINNVTAPSIFGSISTPGPITGLVQTTGQRTDPITSVVTTGVPADLGRLYVNTSGKSPVVTCSTVQVGGFSGKLVSRGDLISQVTLTGTVLTGVIAAQGNVGKIFTPSPSSFGPATRLGGVVVSNPFDGELVTLGTIYADMRFNGGLKAGRIAAKVGIVGNVTLNGIAANGAVVSGGEIGDTTWGTTFTVNGTNKGLIAAKGPVRFPTNGVPGGNVFTNAIGINAGAIDAVFTNSLDLSGLDLGGLELMRAHLLSLHVDISSGNLTDITP